jgi:hypothetical protein
MTTPLMPTDMERIAIYLDGTMEPADRARFEADLASNPALREELEVQSALDASLARLFDDTNLALPEAAPLELTPAPLPFRRVLKWSSMAAVLALVGAGVWLYTNRTDPLLIPPQKVWENMQAVNFKPSWRCENDEQFKQLLTSRLGEAFLIEESPQLKVVGWAYGADYVQYPLSKDTLILINEVGQDHSIILIDRAEKERDLKVPHSTGLHLFKQRRGGLILYELTPRKTPDVLNAVKGA